MIFTSIYSCQMILAYFTWFISNIFKRFPLWISQVLSWSNWEKPPRTRNSCTWKTNLSNATGTGHLSSVPSILGIIIIQEGHLWAWKQTVGNSWHQKYWKEPCRMTPGEQKNEKLAYLLESVFGCAWKWGTYPPWGHCNVEHDGKQLNLGVPNPFFRQTRVLWTQPSVFIWDITQSLGGKTPSIPQIGSF